MPFATTWIDTEIILLSGVSQTDVTNMWNLIKNDTKEHIYKTETDAKILKQTYGNQRGNMGRGKIN